MAFPRADRQYALITDATTGTANTAGGLGAILTKQDQFAHYYAISYASRQLKEHKKNYALFLIESAAAIWGMDVLNEYLKKNHTLHRPGMIESVSKFSLNGTNSNRAIWKPLLMRFPRLGKKGKILMNII
jgi:hypothetical protein